MPNPRWTTKALAIGLSAVMAIAFAVPLPLAKGEERVAQVESDAAAYVHSFAVALLEDVGNAHRLRPSDAQIDALATSSQSAALLRAYVEEIFGQIPTSGSAARPEQTEILIGGPALADLPRGYGDTIEHFRDGISIYGFKYVEPGGTRGMAYDGLIHTGEAWVFIPKAWRAFVASDQ